MPDVIDFNGGIFRRDTFLLIQRANVDYVVIMSNNLEDLEYQLQTRNIRIIVR